MLQNPKEKDAITDLTRQAMHYKNLYIQQRRDNERLRNMLKEQNSTSQHPQIEAQSNNTHRGPRVYTNSDENGKIFKFCQHFFF